MNTFDRAIESTRAAFNAHCELCTQCMGYREVDTSTINRLCLYGTNLYKRMLAAKQDLVDELKQKERIKKAKRR